MNITIKHFLSLTSLTIFLVFAVGSTEKKLICENCKRTMMPDEVAYNTRAQTSTAGELYRLGWHDKLCSPRCLGEWAEKYPSIMNNW